MKNQEFAVIRKLANKLASDTPTITRLILFDFLSKISIRNSLIFYFGLRLYMRQPLLYLDIRMQVQLIHHYIFS